MAQLQPQHRGDERTPRGTSGLEDNPCMRPAGNGAGLSGDTVAGMGAAGQAQRPLRFLPAPTSAQPTAALGRFTEQQ